MKKKCLFLGLATSSICILSILFVNTKGFIGNADFIAKSYEKPYSIVFNDNTNKIGTEKNDDIAHSGSGVAMTGLGNPITFDYNSFYNPTDKWQTIAAGGYLTNTQPISGMTSISLTKSNTSANFAIYWSSTPTFSPERCELFDTNSPLNISSNFNNYLPNYILILAISDSSIDSGIIEFSCSNHYRKLTVNINDENKGSVSGAGVYAIGEEVTISATAIPSYWFNAWRNDSQEIVSYEIQYSFIMPDYDVTYYAEFISLEKGDIVRFGSYPQTKVTSSNIISALNSVAGTLPTESNRQSWISYKYYIISEIYNYMWYIDLTYLDEKYRGVYFDKYRPSSTVRVSGQSTSYQDDNGYFANNVYWFKYEPMRWRVLDVTSSSAFLMSSTIIDSQQYYMGTWDRGPGALPNNYSYSNIRPWLNSTFYNVAFDGVQKTIVKTTNVDNSSNDKVFLMSFAEATNLSYGFENGESADVNRQLSGSDYAKAQGLDVISYYSRWWLRTPYYRENDPDTSSAKCVDSYNGYPQYGSTVTVTSNGVVPAIWISL